MKKFIYQLLFIVLFSNLESNAQETGLFNVVLIGESSNSRDLKLYLDNLKIGQVPAKGAFVYSFAINEKLLNDDSMIKIVSKKGLLPIESAHFSLNKCLCLYSESTFYLYYNRIDQNKFEISCYRGLKFPIEIHSTNLAPSEIHSLRSLLNN